METWDQRILDLLEKNFLEIFLVIALFVIIIILLGGRIKFGRLNISGRKADKDKAKRGDAQADPTLPQHQIQSDFTRLGLSGDLDSFHAITTVLALMTKNGRLIDATLKEASVFAELFYGMDTGNAQTHLVSKSSKELTMLLKPYMDADHFEALKNDQEDLFSAYNDGKPAHAMVPVIFNDHHPYYPNGAYLPVIVSRGELSEREDGQAERLMQIAYFDVKNFEKPVEIYKRSKEGKKLL